MENKLYYLGHASLRITTKEGKVIYIDPYMGTDYSKPADLILVTHDHYDHNEISKVENRNPDCKIITHKEALVDGEHKSFDFGFVKVDTVSAGYNKYHDENVCVGYILTIDNKKIYVLGDTSITPDMDRIDTMNIDYAFIPCDGIYTMNIDEAKEASRKINAKYSIPYHTITDGTPFSEEVANSFDVENRLIVRPEEEIVL